jgi:nucleoside phosphorylase
VANDLTCVLFALAREAMFFRRALAARQAVRTAPCPGWSARLESEHILVLITGMGAAATDRALSWVLRGARTEWPGRILSAGFCGALVPELEVGALLQVTEVIEAANGEGDTQTAGTSPAAHLDSCASGRLITVATPVWTREERQALHGRSGALAADMESATVARRCRGAGVPFACLRAVSDGLNTTISPALAGALQGEQVRLGRLLAAVLRRPLLVGQLSRLARQSRTAAAALSAGLLGMLKAPRQQETP